MAHDEPVVLFEALVGPRRKEKWFADDQSTRRPMSDRKKSRRSDAQRASESSRGVNQALQSGWPCGVLARSNGAVRAFVNCA